MVNSKSPSKPSASHRGAATRTGILESAAKLFAQKGFEGTSLQDIADAMGLTRPAVYHYFASKDVVLSTLVAETSENTADQLRAIRERADGDPASKLHEVVVELVRERTSAPQRFRMLERTESALPPEIAEKHLAARRSVLSELTAIITDGIITGQFRETDERLAALSVLGMSNWVAWWYTPSRPEPAELIASTLADSAVAMMRRPSDRPLASPAPSATIAHIREDLDRLERLLPDA